MCARVCGATRTNSTTHSRPSLLHHLVVASHSLARWISPVLLSPGCSRTSVRRWFSCVSEPRVPDRSDCPRPTSMTRKDNNTAYCRRSFMFRQCWQTVVGPEPPKSARNWPHTTRLFQRVLVHCS